jgi:protein-S-isoprenylcysteine O-methyltransferase Ste14
VTLRLTAGSLLNVSLYAALLFLPAGTFHWWRAWVVIGVVWLGTVGAVFGLRGHDALLAERMKPPLQKGQPLADKIVTLLLLAAFFGLLVFTSRDVFRLRLLPAPGPLVSSLGLVLFCLGWWIAYLSLRENPFAAPVVKHQVERNQTVIDTGLYGVVRHPMYAGAVLLTVGTPLWLESYAGALLASLPIALLLVRIVFEERFLRRQLPGYSAYTEKVPFRLIPFLW